MPSIVQNPAQKSRIQIAPAMQQPFVHYEFFSGTAAAVGTTGFISDWISDVRFQLVMAGGETAIIQGTRDGTNFVTITQVVDEATGNRVTAAVAAALPSGNYKLPLRNLGQWRRFKVTKSAAVSSCQFIFTAARPYRSAQAGV